ncbi:Flavine halogenase aclH [Lachnellula arida]|uniref:Flavine halogenase aclH n=1 Tax=Lachnellula arida TaxID=1316785 RepID=A0A8T9BEQ2_9HELO|nr:Flavine halogenase aclH [Lachnellula arida]
MKQDLAISKRQYFSSTEEFYSASLKLALDVLLLKRGKLVVEIRSASDYTYSSSSCVISYARVVGDAGCFIDPFFSLGVHRASVSALSAAITICAPRRGDGDEVGTAKWHSHKVKDGYEHFTFIVLSAYRQIRNQEKPVVSDIDEDNFNRAFPRFQPIIQGTADISGTLTHAELSKKLDFCSTLLGSSPQDRAKVLKKVLSSSNGTLASAADRQYQENTALFHANLTAEKERVAEQIRARKMMRMEDATHLENFKTGVIDGFRPVLQRGVL